MGLLADKMLKAGLVTKADITRVEQESTIKERHREASRHIERAVKRLLEIDSSLVDEMTRWSHENNIDIPGDVLIVWSALDHGGVLREWAKWCAAARETA